jgi:hypothetical protein
MICQFVAFLDGFASLVDVIFFSIFCCCSDVASISFAWGMCFIEL